VPPDVVNMVGPVRCPCVDDSLLLALYAQWLPCQVLCSQPAPVIVIATLRGTGPIRIPAALWVGSVLLGGYWDGLSSLRYNRIANSTALITNR
jgi:hypothetical protein